MTSLTLKSKDIMYVNGNAVLYVTGDVLMQGNGATASQIVIAPDASLSIYVGGSSASFTQVNNQGNAKTFNYYGLPANTGVSFGGNAAFIGTIYAPNAEFTIGGGGNDPYDFEGSVMSKTIKMNGHFKFHFDENLARSGPSFGYVVASWKEL
jgi:choice-of-anchor A domain-containing protein